MTRADNDARAKPEVSVVCPMYNEGERIAANLEHLFAALERLGRSWEVILINDGSTDDSGEHAERVAALDSRLRLIGYPVNRGRGFAIRQGFQAARGEIIAVTESDLSWGGDIIERMVEAIDREDADAVIASPYLSGGGLANVPAGRVFLSKFGNRLLRRLLPGGHTMNTGMTRAYRRHVIDSLDLESDGKEIHLEIVAKLHALGYRVVEVPAVLTWPKGRGRRKSSFRAGRLIRSHLNFGIAEYPLLLFGTIGLIELVLGAAIALYLLGVSLSGTPVAGRPLLLVSILLILMGVLVMLFSFLALQVRDLRRSVFRLQGLLHRMMKEKDTGRKKAQDD